MRLKTETNQESSLRLTSFIDVIFILLLFFIVTSLIMKQSGGRQGERAYLKVQNAFSEVSQVHAFLTVFIYEQNGRLKYRLIHKGAKTVPFNYLRNLTRESKKAEPDRSVIIYTTETMLRDQTSVLSRAMDTLNFTTIQDVLTYYRKILKDNDLNFAIVAQPDVPFFSVIQLYSFMKTSIPEGGLGASHVVLLELDGDLNDFLDKVKWGTSQ
jgi:hypothetical protein